MSKPYTPHHRDKTVIRPMNQAEREASKTREEVNMAKKPKKGKKYGK